MRECILILEDETLEQALDAIYDPVTDSFEFSASVDDVTDVAREQLTVGTPYRVAYLEGGPMDYFEVLAVDGRYVN